MYDYAWAVGSTEGITHSLALYQHRTRPLYDWFVIADIHHPQQITRPVDHLHHDEQQGKLLKLVQEQDDPRRRFRMRRRRGYTPESAELL